MHVPQQASNHTHVGQSRSGCAGSQAQDVYMIADALTVNVANKSYAGLMHVSSNSCPGHAHEGAAQQAHADAAGVTSLT